MRQMIYNFMQITQDQKGSIFLNVDFILILYRVKSGLQFYCKINVVVRGKYFSKCELTSQFAACRDYQNISANHYFFSLLFQEEALQLKRLVSARSGPGSSDPSSSSAAGGSSGSSSNRNDAFTVQAMSPDATALSTTYIYAALVVLVIGIIIGKWIF